MPKVLSGSWSSKRHHRALAMTMAEVIESVGSRSAAKVKLESSGEREAQRHSVSRSRLDVQEAIERLTLFAAEIKAAADAPEDVRWCKTPTMPQHPGGDSSPRLAYRQWNALKRSRGSSTWSESFSRSSASGPSRSSASGPSRSSASGLSSQSSFSRSTSGESAQSAAALWCALRRAAAVRTSQESKYTAEEDKESDREEVKGSTAHDAAARRSESRRAKKLRRQSIRVFNREEEMERTAVLVQSLTAMFCAGFLAILAGFLLHPLALQPS